ncbi:uncharacterized protein MEPE_03908 [Melanopsichium pennsylvanicum]|uniref:BRCT domain-containing protein n=2 Tax=Melanopsichium pennsylvanicum TaxID=63383 RepID=A0AAJ5C653_9BASI|nr:conserved hypothetical protein [Melanopsichium pennsylvanicum 4]SNX85199.1 uncharacterized protein MEPE_03908 [Melanopsichium pennsylvanicum]
MSTTSPQKRRATIYRSSMLEHPMRQTRSMVRISDATDFSELSTCKEQHQSALSSQPRSSSPRKARASQAAELQSFDPDSPDVSMAACMESPKKGRFDDFEFELENCNPDVPTRRRRIGGSREKSTSPSTGVGLPRSSTSAMLRKNVASHTLLVSRKENSPTAQPQQKLAGGASPVKPLAALPRASRLHGPTPSTRTSSQATLAASSDQKPPSATVTAPTKASAADSKPAGSSRDSSHRLLFGPSESASGPFVERSPFHSGTEPNCLAALGEPRHSPVKRFQAKSEFIISSPDRPDRKPINLLELKPSPGKAQRGIFRHDAALNKDDDDQDDWDAGEDEDEIRLIKGPAVKNEADSIGRDKTAASSDPNRSPTSSSSASAKHVRATLSTETSDALASLEASLAKLKAKTCSAPSSAAVSKRREDSSDSALKRELASSCPATGLISSRTQIFNTMRSTNTGNDSSYSGRSHTDHSGEENNNVFKRPSGRVSALAKSRESSSDLRSTLGSSLASSKSMMSFGAPRLPGYSESNGRPSKPVLTGLRKSSLEVASSDDSLAEERAAQEEEEARVAEQKKQAVSKAAKRKSMSSVLSSGMPPPLQRKDPESAKQPSSSSSSADHSSTRIPSTNASTTATEPSAVDSAGARKAAKAARRRSLYTYVPTQKSEDGDRSLGNLSTSLIPTSSLIATTADGDTSSAASKKARFLRGLTVLVDVRDQDGEDASACWVEMLKNAGAKVLVRFGERKLTHIVYKSGRPSTLHGYRALEDPKPHVVGVTWVVACLEQGKKAEESPYLVEVGKQAIFATRRRSSMAPKQAPSSASLIRELPKEKLKAVEQAKKKLLAHAPAVSSPLRRRVSSSSILASRLAAASLDANEAKPFSTSSLAMTADGSPRDNEDKDVEKDGNAMLESYRARVKSVLSSQRAAVAA